MTRPPLLLGCIADDFTGATDLCNMLVRGGLRTIPAAEAVAQSLDALRWLQEQGCRQVYFKYCSTFDSTDAGNIGPVAEALMAALGSGITLACPAFPEAGRTVYRGHLFVGDVPLSESGMRDHPLTPMRDANLVRVLQRQSKGKVGLLRHDAIAAGRARAEIDALAGAGVRLAIADAVSDADLDALGRACLHLPLVTGGSGLGLGLAGALREAGELRAADRAAAIPGVAGRSAVLAGSCSEATNAQVAAWSGPAFRIDPLRLARREPVVAEALAFAGEHDEAVLVYATAGPEEVRRVQEALGGGPAGALVEEAMAAVAHGLHAAGTRRFVVAGGETAGAVVQAIGAGALRIGPQIDPGVPWTVTLGEAPVALALKSGNFGGADFFAKALRMLPDH